MNGFQEPALVAQPTDVDPIEFWQLDEKPRFPVAISDWDRAVILPDRPIAKIVGGHAYDLVINRKARRPATRTMDKLLTAFRTDFAKASEFFDPAQWRLLFYLDIFPFAVLGNPGFDASKAIREICAQESFYTEVPWEWIGSVVPVADLLDEIRYGLYPDADLSKAIWAILGFARSLGLEKNEVLQICWWETSWLERCCAAYR